MSVKQHRQQQQFKNDLPKFHPWWERLGEGEQLFTENFEPVDSIGEDEIQLLKNVPSGVMFPRLPTLAELDRDEEYFDS